MSEEEVKAKEEELRRGFCKALKCLDTGGRVPYGEAKYVLVVGGLWHHAHELLKTFEDKKHEETMEGTVEMKATGIHTIK